MTQDLIWQTKLAARIHDPAEKALVLLRDPAGHENGTSHALRRLLGLDQIPADKVNPDNADALASVLFKGGLPADVYRLVQRADWWAAAADRPQWPMEEITVTTKQGKEKTFAVARWGQVRWTNQPVLIHPLTGEQYDMGQSGGLSETDFHGIKEKSFDHFSRLLVQLGAQDGGPQDLRKILLAYWRFGPDLTETDDNSKLGALWRLLPADTRVPDHSIWDHLDLTSAFAGAFAGDANGEAALLALSIGPVQSFIAQARTTSDLWAGSHLLSRLAWEAMRPVCESFGPDAILFPRLRGIGQVDLWLRDQMGLPEALFQDCEWLKGATDANPLFSAALPNRFVAVVPASRAREIAEQVEASVRDWLQETGNDVVSRLLKEAGFDIESTETPYAQMKSQLAGFPEVHWSVVPFSLIRPRDTAKQTNLDTSALNAAMAPFFGSNGKVECGFLVTPAWQLLAKSIDWADGTTFFAPNPGVLYPAVYDLAERVMAAAKSTRTFAQGNKQEGWRCSLTGETEWLTTDRANLQKSYRQQADTLWAKVSRTKPSWAKQGEHLGALPAIKRLWPTIFAEEVGKALNPEDNGKPLAIGRFVVSTHTMALAKQLDDWLERGGLTAKGLPQQMSEPRADSVALPRKLMLKHSRNRDTLDNARRILALLEAARDADDDAALDRAQELVRNTLAQGASKGDEVALENYYAMLMMDGDRMGAILSGVETSATTYRDSFHPQVQQGFDQHSVRKPQIKAYGSQARPISPNRHLAISGALNDFSQTVVRHVVEAEYLGRVIYAGGDDVMAMLPVADLLPASQRLRYAYSGSVHAHEQVSRGDLQQRDKLVCKSGFAALNGRLMRMMGATATASTGAVIAHHQAPLVAVMRELRAAEQRAKGEGGRDAFSLTIIKRSGGTLQLTVKWGEPLALLNDLRDFLAAKGTSRRAAYNSLQWLPDIPNPRDNHQMVAALLAYQFARQTDNECKPRVPGLAQRLAQLASELPATADASAWLANFIGVAEFLARGTRSGGSQ
jgi:CRISPR-associated protein Cmr2